ncbi:hypothetical protein [Natrinema salifodinae]|uniref:Uncharacterized protein n=1 Tax=Natrinema salifodinae TaxID=1202768 RepID=A0A1I0PHB4_9EURY|nr:hypothetical protein [Natrinema salifodinae]SEW13578.1 hypothetical protein SAMN05216285_2554 [Natrinema salifodinae]
MPNDSTSAEESERDPTDSFDLERSERVRVGVTRGERSLELGPPRDFPDRADVAVRPKSDEADEGDGENGEDDAADKGGARLVLSIDAMAGDHGRGYVDAELTPREARALRDRLDETVRWMIGSDAECDSDRDVGSSGGAGRTDRRD